MLHLTQYGEPCALVSGIQKYTIHDGPGIRTTVFFMGCALRCLWCSNPETLYTSPRLGVYPGKCISRQKCGHCINNCPLKNERVIAFDENGILKAVHMREECENCFKCAEACPPRAIKIWGEKMTLGELMKVINEDRSFYLNTGGGVTLNGGEVMLQWEFAETLLRSCKETSINTCVETSLHCPREHMEAVYHYTDLVITDIKHMDSVKHREYTGAGNETILGNIKRTAELGKKFVIRTPVVPGYNGDEENIRKTGEFIRSLGGKILQYQLLPYRRLGTEKYDSLGMRYPMADYLPPERSEWERNLAYLAAMLVDEYGLPAVAGSGKKLPASF
jgi:pyruvate formate lyase activating enzyme